MYRTDNWVNEGSDWIVELIDSQYINISTYRPLSGISYMKLPADLKSPRKGLINIKSKDQKCFLRCHVRHINPSKSTQKESQRKIKNLVKDLDYDETDFPVQENDFGKIGKKDNICINLFCYENGLVFPKYISDQNIENSMVILFVTDGDKWHYVYIKDFDRFMFHKTRIKNKKWFCRSCVLVIKMC